MTHFGRLASQAIPLAPLAAVHAGGASTSPGCEVRQRETSFARSMANHGAVAFAGYLNPRAALGASRKPMVGREAIVREWQGIINGSQLGLEWYPDVVTIGGDDRAAYSSGPSLHVDPKTRARAAGPLRSSVAAR